MTRLVEENLEIFKEYRRQNSRLRRMADMNIAEKGMAEKGAQFEEELVKVNRRLMAKEDPPFNFIRTNCCNNVQATTLGRYSIVKRDPWRVMVCTRCRRLAPFYLSNKELWLEQRVNQSFIWDRLSGKTMAVSRHEVLTEE